jgi:hypothetical protein
VGEREQTANLIKDWGVKSVQQWQRLDIDLPHTLPGISPDGRSLNTPYPGYLCPVQGSNGLLVALQVRTRNPQPDDPKYYWLTSATQRNPSGATPHLSNGELPLARFLPKELKHSWIGIAEGTGAKPLIASERLGIPVIGAAGGQWASSPEFFQQAVESNAELHPMIVLSPDAGQYDAKHKSVVNRCCAIWKLCNKLGYEFRVLWWEQIDKSVGDIDEISDERLRAAKLLTFAQFESIIHQDNQSLEKVLELFRRRRGERKKHCQQQPQQHQENPNVHHYEPGDRLVSWQSATEAGYKYILDRSGTGEGKSYDSGTVQLRLFDLRQAQSIARYTPLYTS